MDKIKNGFLLMLLVLIAAPSFAQININTPDVCLGNVSSFSYSSPSSSTISSYTWTFGDGFSSTMASPRHLYKNTGSFTVKVEAKTSSGAIETANLQIKVYALPTAELGATGLLKACLNTNAICLKDESTPATSSQTITSKIIIWGDGAYEKSNASEFCHTYSNADLFTVSYEVTDKYGCKGFDTAKIEVVPSVEAIINYTVNYISCTEARICVLNKSEPTKGSVVNYKWIIDGNSLNKSLLLTPHCFNISTSKTIKVKLFANNSVGCSDTTEVEIPIKFDTGRTMTLSDSLICYGDVSGIRSSYPLLNGEKGNWYLNDSFLGPDSIKTFIPKHIKNINIGMNYVKLEVLRGNCKETFLDSFLVTGPKAEILLFNHTQCNTNRKVFFVGEPQLKFVDHLKYQWTLTDPNGEVCTAERAKNKNKYKNCNESSDWWHKHIYQDIRNGYRVKFQVTDTVTGCTDQALDVVNLLQCGNCELLVNCEPAKICQNEWLFTNTRGADDPFLVTLDSGRTWQKYPIFIDESYSGKYDLGFMYKFTFPGFANDFGDDSIQLSGPITLYDTILCSQNLTVIPLVKDSFTLSVQNSCRPLSFRIHMANGKYNAGDSLLVHLGDSLLEIITSSDSFRVDSLSYSIDTTGFSGSVYIIYKRNGCQVSYSQYLGVGYSFHLSQTGNACTNEQLCFIADVIDKKSSNKWSLNNNYGSIEWYLDSIKQSEIDFTFCKQIKDYGPHTLQAIVTNNDGCKDTIKQPFIVQEVSANVTSQSRSFYCNKLRQFFDSSELKYPSKDDKIVEYLWDWGTNNYSTLKKDPFKSFVGIYDSVVVSHIAVSKSGCRDTITYTLDIQTSKPKFHIKDSLGCSPLKVEFFNESENCSQYIWEFGDSSNNTYFSFKKDNPTFTYTKPGTYYINLIGIDTIYNPYTGSVYYCQNSYPIKNKSISVTVLPTFKTGINAPDTICQGASVNFKSLSDTGFTYDKWNFGDGSGDVIRATGSNYTYSFSKEGLYTVKLNPFATALPGQPYCHEKASKDITVLGISADFVVDPSSIDPIFKFNNQSNPITANFNWNFGDPPSGSKNTSTDVHPSHNYNNRNGTHTVCLVATNSFGCKDSTCIDLESNYTSKLNMYNTFTPGNNDGSNDEFDIEIEGEAVYELTIFNRYGTQVFQGKVDGFVGDGQNWNGKINNTGADCASGTYFYSFTYSFADDPENKNTVEGVITLIR